MGAFAEARSLGLIVELFLKSSVVLAAGIIGSRLLRRGGASLRHFLLSLSLVGLVFLPALSVFSPGWHARWLPDWTRGRFGSDAGADAVAAGVERPAPGLLGEWGMGRDALGPQGPGAGALGERAVPERLRAVLATVLPSFWLAGLVLILARLMAGLCGARRLTREGEALEDSAWQRLLHRFVSAVRLRRRVDIKAHPEVIVPLTWGFRRPVVILPEEARDWTEDERSSALFHELSHVKRGDFLVMILVRLSLALFWFNPLCWIVLKMLKKDQEKACDELVLKAGIRPSTYANNLLFFKRSIQSTRSPLAVLPGVLGMFGRSEFHERLMVILGRRVALKEVPMKTKFAVSVLVFLAVAFIGLARPRTAAATSETAFLVTDAAAAVTSAAAQETPAQDTQKAAEKQKKEEPKPAEPKKDEGQVKKEIKIIRQGQGGAPVEITIIDGKTEKAIKLDGTVIIKKGEDGKTIVLDSDGKELAVIGGEGAEIKIKGGQITFDQGKELEPAKEPKVFTVIEGDQKTSYVLEGGNKAHTVIVKSRPHLEIVKEVEEPEHVTIKYVRKGDGEFTIAKPYLVKEPAVRISVRKAELEKKLAETQALLKKIDELKLAESDLKAQRETLRELQESLKALEEELNKTSENLKTLKVVAEPKVYIAHEHAEAPDVEVEEITPDEQGREDIVKVTGDKENYAIMLDMKLKGNPKEAYEKAVAKLEKELPVGYKLEPKFEEKTGTMVIKITGPKGSEEDREKIQKLIKELQAELKK